MENIKKVMFNRYRYVSERGKVSKRYKDIDEVLSIYEGQAGYLLVNSSTGAINKSAKEIVKPKKGNKIIPFLNFVIVIDTKNQGFQGSVRKVDLTGETLEEYDDITKIDEFYSVEKNGKYGLLDSGAEIIFDCRYNDEIKPLRASEELFWVNGRKRYSPRFIKCKKFNYINDSKYRIVNKYGKLALLDSDSYVILEAKYDSIKILQNKIEAVLNGEMFFYDLDGNLLVDNTLKTGGEDLVDKECCDELLIDDTKQDDYVNINLV